LAVPEGSSSLAARVAHRSRASRLDGHLWVAVAVSDPVALGEGVGQVWAWPRQMLISQEGDPARHTCWLFW